jgi:hypothetical protein
MIRLVGARYDVPLPRLVAPKDRGTLSFFHFLTYPLRVNALEAKRVCPSIQAMEEGNFSCYSVSE